MTIDGSDNPPAQAHGKQPLKIVIRTLAGHNRKDTVKPDATVAAVTDDAVAYFVHKNELGAGEYALTLPRMGADAELDATASLTSVGVIDGDVLVLVSRKPQIDG